MAEVTGFSHGNFCWFELATSDAGGAKNFYSNLFGWNPNDMPMGPDAVYTMLELQGRQVGALYALGPQEQNMPPHWRVYIAVDNVDEITNKAKSLGATAIMEPFDVMDVGRMAVIQDPTGAIINFWQAKRHTGAAVVDEPNSFCWYELNTNDTEKAKNFYTNLLGWTVKESPEYTEWVHNGRSIGGMMAIKAEWGNVPPNWTAYVMVNDVNASSQKAQSLGGQLAVPPMEIPGTGQFSIISDPQGAMLAMYEPIKK